LLPFGHCACHSANKLLPACGDVEATPSTQACRWYTPLTTKASWTISTAATSTAFCATAWYRASSGSMRVAR